MIDQEVYDLSQTGDEVQAILDKGEALPSNPELQAALNSKADKADTYTKPQVDAKISQGIGAAQAAAESASQDAQNASESAAEAAQRLEDLETAIQQLPDGQAVSAQVAINTADIAALQQVVADIETIAEGCVRVAGSSSPALNYKTYKYHEQGGFGRESVFHLFYPCLVGTALTGSGTEGKILSVLKKFGARTVDGVAKWEDLDGNLHAIDGSEGDVQIVNIEPYFRIMGKHTIEGTEYDVFLVSRVPFTWQGIDAQEVLKGGVSPDYCVSHADSDGVTRMHSVFNPDWAGSYSAPAGVVGKYVQSQDEITGEITESYDAEVTLLGGSGGLHTTDIDLPTGEQRAMNNNPDTTKCVPWMNQTAASVEDWFAVMLAEGGTFDAHNATRMGSGFSANDPASSAGDWDKSGSGAKNGCRVQDKNGTWKNYSLASFVNFLFGQSTGQNYAATCINSWRSPWHIMEAQRAVSYAIQHDVHELEWFVFEGNKYKYRSVTGFNGPAQGEMTCVVWKLMATKAGANAVDPTDGTTSIAGNRVEFLVSTALFHGITTQVSPSWWVSGLLFTEDENGNYLSYMERDQSRLIKSETGSIDVTESFNFELQYPQVGPQFTKGDGYAKNYLNDALMLPNTNANKTGGGLHTYVGKYNYFAGDNAAEGKKLVRGFRRGSYAYSTGLSSLCVYAFYPPSYANSTIAFGTCCRISD